MKPHPSSLRPPETPIELVSAAGGVTVSIPPAGFRGPWLLLVLFGAFWLVGGLGFTGALLAGVVKDSHNRQVAPLEGLPLVGLFWFVGLLMFGIGWQMARRRSVLLLTAQALVFSQEGPLRKSAKIWPREKLQGVTVGPSNVSVNNRPLPQLKVKLVDGSSPGILTGRSDVELAWLAAELTAALTGAGSDAAPASEVTA